MYIYVYVCCATVDNSDALTPGGWRLIRTNQQAGPWRGSAGDGDQPHGYKVSGFGFRASNFGYDKALKGLVVRMPRILIRASRTSFISGPLWRP